VSRGLAGAAAPRWASEPGGRRGHGRAGRGHCTMPRQGKHAGAGGSRTGGEGACAGTGGAARAGTGTPWPGARRGGREGEGGGRAGAGAECWGRGPRAGPSAFTWGRDEAAPGEGGSRAGPRKEKGAGERRERAHRGRGLRGGRRFDSGRRRASRVGDEEERTCAGGGGRGERQFWGGGDWRVGPTRGATRGAQAAAEPRGGSGAGRARGPVRPCGREPGHRGAGWATAGSRPKREGGFYFPFFHFSYLALNSIPRMLFTNLSTTSKKIMVLHDATTKENISRVYSHKVSS
jgi:hypothetical protein